MSLAESLYDQKFGQVPFRHARPCSLLRSLQAPLVSEFLLSRFIRAEENYSNPGKDPRGPWTTKAVQVHNYCSSRTYEIISPSGRAHLSLTGTYCRIFKTNFNERDPDKRIWRDQDGASIPRVKKFLVEAKEGVVPATWWPHSHAGTNAEAKQEVRQLIGSEGDMCLTPKPEKLLKQVLAIAANFGHLVLGSGITAAVAHDGFMEHEGSGRLATCGRD